MLTLHVEAANFSELKIKVEQAMGVAAPISDTVVEKIAEINAAPNPRWTPPAPEPEVKKPGRPRKSAPAPEAQAASSAAKPAVSEPQAQVGNSASGGSAAPAEATPPSPAQVASAPAAGDVTFEDMKAKLQVVAAKREGDKDDNDGLARAAGIISRYGYRKIKEVQPKDFAAIVADCEKA